MIISFSNIPLVLACLVGVLIFTSHALSAFGKEEVRRIATLVGAFLHAVFFILFFLAGAEIDLAAAALMASVLSYSVMSYVAYLKGKEADDK
jgi:hypothetical protein